MNGEKKISKGNVIAEEGPYMAKLERNDRKLQWKSERKGTKVKFTMKSEICNEKGIDIT